MSYKTSAVANDTRSRHTGLFIVLYPSVLPPFEHSPQHNQDSIGIVPPTVPRRRRIGILNQCSEEVQKIFST